MPRKLLLVGWDAADWKLISPLLDAGKLPAFASLIERGVMGNLATLQPCLSPLLWTSIATGKFADKHGILGFVEPDGQGGVRHASSTSRKTKALWNILSQSGLRTHIVGWFATHPAEPINGVCVSNLFDQNPGPLDQRWPVPAGAVHPDKWLHAVHDLRMHPAEVTAADLQPFIPRLAEIDRRSDRRPLELAKAIAHAVSVQSIATAILENEPSDFVAVYFEFLDAIGHVFMPYHPPQLDHVPQGDFDLYQHVMTTAYQFQDQMLSRLLELAGDDTSVIVISDHGFYSDRRRPRSLHAGDSPESLAAHWHRQFGILCIADERVRQDDRVNGATLLDVCPTILTLLGLPVGRDMDGRPLVQAFRDPVQFEWVDSWDAVEGASGMHGAEQRIDPVNAQATIDHLVSLGYLEPAAAHADRAVQVAVNESKFNLAAVYMGSFRSAKAIAPLEELHRLRPDEPRYALSLARAYSDCRRFAEAGRQLEKLVAAGVCNPEIDVLMATVCFDRGEEAAAMECLARAASGAPDSLAVHLLIGSIHETRHRWQDAESAFQKAVDVDPESPQAHNGLSRALLARSDYEGAASHALDAIAITYQYPVAHYHLGVAMEGLGDLPRAAQSLETAVLIAPSFREARQRLAELFIKLEEPEKAAHHLSKLDTPPSSPTPRH